MKPHIARMIITKIILYPLLVGCASTPLAPVRVSIPVFTPCIKTVPLRPVYEFHKLPPAAEDGEIILALARDWLRGRQYEGELEIAVAGCR